MSYGWACASQVDDQSLQEDHEEAFAQALESKNSDYSLSAQTHTHDFLAIIEHYA